MASQHDFQQSIAGSSMMHGTCATCRADRAEPPAASLKQPEPRRRGTIAYIHLWSTSDHTRDQLVLVNLRLTTNHTSTSIPNHTSWSTMLLINRDNSPHWLPVWVAQGSTNGLFDTYWYLCHQFGNDQTWIELLHAKQRNWFFWLE